MILTKLRLNVFSPQNTGHDQWKKKSSFTNVQKGAAKPPFITYSTGNTGDEEEDDGS